MTVVETLLIFVGIPALGFAVLAALVFAGSSGRAPRYRPGRGWTHEDVWYLPRPAHPSTHSGHAALTAGSDVGTGAISTSDLSGRMARGGASGTW